MKEKETKRKRKKLNVYVQKGNEMKLGESWRNKRTEKIKNEKWNMFGDFRKVEKVKFL